MLCFLVLFVGIAGASVDVNYDFSVGQAYNCPCAPIVHYHRLSRTLTVVRKMNKGRRK